MTNALNSMTKPELIKNNIALEDKIATLTLALSNQDTPSIEELHTALITKIIGQLSDCPQNIDTTEDLTAHNMGACQPFNAEHASGMMLYALNSQSYWIADQITTLEDNLISIRKEEPFYMDYKGGRVDIRASESDDQELRILTALDRAETLLPRYQSLTANNQGTISDLQVSHKELTGSYWTPRAKKQKYDKKALKTAADTKRAEILAKRAARAA